MNKRDNLFLKAIQDVFFHMKEKERINSKEIDASWNVVKESLHRVSPQTVTHRKSAVRVLTISSIAAVIVLFVSIYAWRTSSSSDVSSQLQEIIVPIGQNKLITLSDGSRLHIKANSRVAYPNVFEKNRREIMLLDGEIYLEVTHNPKAPFTVKTRGFNVRVLGTKFDVSVAKLGKPSSVVLVKGSVEVENVNKKKVRLVSNQKACIYLDQINVKRVNVLKYICWKDRIILLEGDTLEAILEQLSSFYGVNISCDKSIKNFMLSGKLDLNDSIEKTIRILRLSTGFHYRKDKDRFYIYKN